MKIVPIINLEKDIILFNERKIVEVVENEYEDWDVCLENDVIATCGFEDLAVIIMSEIVKRIENGNEYVDLNEIYENVEV